MPQKPPRDRDHSNNLAIDKAALQRLRRQHRNLLLLSFSDSRWKTIRKLSARIAAYTMQDDVAEGFNIVRRSAV